jgi:hypothetical protein
LSAGFQVRLHFFYAILAELKFVVKACFFKQIFSRTNRRQSEISVNLRNQCQKFFHLKLAIGIWNLKISLLPFHRSTVQPRNTRYERPATRDEFGQTRRYPKGKIRNFKKFFTISLLFTQQRLTLFFCTLSAARCTLFLYQTRRFTPL